MDDCGGNDCGACDVCIAGFNDDEFAEAEAVLHQHGMLPLTPRQKQQLRMRALEQRRI